PVSTLAMPSYKLSEFDTRGLAEVSRQLFILSGTPYEDNRISKDQWPALKEKYGFGELPVLEVDGKQIPQSLAIARYLAKEFGFYGANAFEAAWIDALADQAKDFISDIHPYFAIAMGMVAGDTDKAKAEIALPAIKKHFDLFEKVAKDNGSNSHFVGSNFSYFDILISEFVFSIDSFLPGSFDAFPTVLAVRAKVTSIPAIKEWIEKRPKTVT
ncbi:hypothetical protein PENTCL1PPCAC_14801, partial [Pristionchus entomophagus]